MFLLKNFGKMLMASVLSAGLILFAGFTMEIHADSEIAVANETDFQQITDPANANAHFILTSDITLTGEWVPSDFNGILDGNGYVLKDLTVSADTSDAGLFTSLGSDAAVRNLGFLSAQISSGSGEVGLIAAHVDAGSQIAQCLAVNSSVTKNGQPVTNTLTGLKFYDLSYEGAGSSGEPYILKTTADLSHLSDLVNGGIRLYAGASYALGQDIPSVSILAIGTQSNPFSGTLDGRGHVLSGTFGANADGDAGLFGTVSNASIRSLGLTGSVTGSRYAGGLAGNVLAASSASITQSYTSATVKGTSTSSTYTGGLVGYASGNLTVASSYTTGTATNGYKNGGFVGAYAMEPVISNSYTTAAKFFGESSGVLALTNSFSTDYESGGLVRAPLAEMRKGTFAVTLNTGNSENGGDPVYGAVLGRTPVLLGVGEGTGASIPYQLNIEPPTNGTLQVYANNVLVADDEYVAKGSTLTLTGVPATGYEVKSIKADNSALTLSGGRSTVVINAPMTVSAEFGEYTAFQIKVTKNSGGTVTPSDATVLVRAGAQQTFIINPDTGCRIKSVKYSGSGLTVNGNTYTTGTVNRNETLTVTFASKSDGIKDVEVITDGSVVVTVKSLENVAEQIEDNIGNTIKVDMSKSTVIDKTTLQAMTGNDVDVILDMKTYSWRINGESVSSRVNTSINLGVNPSAASIDAAYMSRFSAFEDKSQIDLTYSGSFPFVGYLTVKAPGTNPVGKYASLFYFNESTKEFEAMGYERVADDGTVTYRFTHASKYVMVVSNRILSVQDLSVGAGFREVSIPITMKRTDLLFASLLFGGVVLGGVLLFIGLRRMK